jgi:hypothetical protein
MTSAAGLWHSYLQAVGVFDKGVSIGLGKWGALVAKRPLLTVVLSTIVALGLSAGLVMIGDLVETDAYKLWCAASFPPSVIVRRKMRKACESVIVTSIATTGHLPQQAPGRL